MDTKAKLMLVVCGLAIVGAGIALDQLRTRQRLGNPGVRLVDQPSLNVKKEPIGTQSVPLPEKVKGFTSEYEPVPDAVLTWLPKDTTYGQRRYRAADGFWVSSTVVLMGSDRGSIHKPQICLVGQGWDIEKSELEHLRIEHPHVYDLPVMRLKATKEVQLESGQRIKVSGIYAYWFVSQDQLTADHWERQWWMAKDLLTRGILQRWAYVSYFAVCMPGMEQATFERMKGLMVESVPSFQLVAGPKLMASAAPATTSGGDTTAGLVPLAH